ncbi:hypothetical protein [Bordetella bronchiseptica]|uniref:hypothetical protein n=1 Tax=Bordetella bronchiseptica TaxID=518 RepID=UPI000927E929|nr:hypothetical protein [Bordetella bronchiseptica]WLS60406.1 hypothetical protein RAK14_06930 [Bordetella bronchiseptica]WLS61553.1 hypothetical protein RAK14_24600 [Bordetella bronchiseptica]WLS65240.1 hypothetical protein RAK11_06930 [Bordetella bronchiseptica]SHT49486.1 Uncharacterised protein [Mycobacteroides abscessus subsp. abscessus]
MKNLPLVLRVYGERSNGQWSLICLDFNLAVQADTLPQAQQRLHSMIVGYLRDALEGEDRPYAAQLLTRRAPLGFWLKYYLAKLRTCVVGQRGSRRVAGSEAIPMAPAGA